MYLTQAQRGFIERTDKEFGLRPRDWANTTTNQGIPEAPKNQKK